MKWPTILACLVAILLSACSTLPAGDPAERPPGDPEAEQDPASARPPTSDEVMYRVFAGEVLGTEGDLEGSAAEYLAAALESEDPEIAERATRVAIAARSWQYASMAADRWVMLEPESLDARQAAIQAMLVAGDYVAAEHQMAGLLEQLEHDPGRAWAMIAAQLAAARNPGKAWATLERLIEDRQAGGNADALFAQSQLAARMGELPAADQLAVTAVSLAPDRPELHAWAGRLAVNVEDMDRALAHYRSAWKLKPDDRTIALAYAELLKRRGEIDGSLAVLAALPDTPETRFARIAFALDAERPETAQDIYRGFEAVDYDDGNERAFQAGQAAEMLGRGAEAIAWYEQVHSGERALVAVLRRALLIAGAGELEQARNLLASTRIHRDQAILVETYLTESQILIDAGQPQEAFELLGDALELVPENTQFLYSRALVAVQLDRIAAAEADLRFILEREPRNAAALNALGYTLADRTDRYEEAEQLIRSAYDLQPGEASIIDSMGWVAYRRGRLEEAAGFLMEAWTRDQNPEIAAHLGEVLWSLGRESEARDIWRQGLERDTENAVLNETLGRFGVEF